MASHGLSKKVRTLQQPQMRIQKKRELVCSYPYLEAVGKARIMGKSQKPAPSREHKAVSYHYTVPCEFPTFPDTFDNQLMPLFCLTAKIVEASTPATSSP